VWIRSQDKKFLGEYKFIFVQGSEIHAECTLDVDTLGKYATEDRALQVLDDIASEINCYDKDHNIYKMPQK